jgi:ArsR family transcriptional regulator, arsenate/arsenite/antimonite-responsive transcriptional repressor
MSIYGYTRTVTITALPLSTREAAETAATASDVPAVGACCAPLTRETITAADADVFARRLKALADPVRLRLVSIVAASEGQEACVCDLIEPVGLSQPTVSHHLRILVEAGLLSRDKRGVWAYYRVVPAALDALADVLRTSGRG